MDIQERINHYWSRRADEFGDARYSDMKSKKRENWTKLISEHLPEKEKIHALDLGTGAGFFSFILRDLGCCVTGIDYSDAMLRNARKNCKRLGFDEIQFLQMDAQNLQFEDGTFDFIFTRNVTWTLPDPAKAYQEMCRVLAPGGKLMNADANYSAGFKKMDAEGLTEKYSTLPDMRYQYPARSLEMLRERNDIAKTLYIADEKRPVWDLDILSECGMDRFWIDLDVNSNIFKMDSNKSLSVSPEFVLVAEKLK
ncbi:MAG: class I SAM-dependent methyltransferase [Streptococcus sp.]|uniref:class I SAM-dependent methyltransferase n=1 Tax=Streptococcus sp. TaxID=1306 RepID=UPI00258AB9C9|nr:class I SAM-dependent methyltransferase [Streptococcus sp.]MCR5493900.1 class I SAM-dependent methyltransferase [Streptococcus sp.]